MYLYYSVLYYNVLSYSVTRASYSQANNAQIRHWVGTSSAAQDSCVGLNGTSRSFAVIVDSN